MTFTWDLAPTPFGPALAAFTDDGLVALTLVDSDPGAQVERLIPQLGDLPDHAPGAAAALAIQLEEYFDGGRREFDITLDWRLATGFTREALSAIRTIPYGTTASYGEVAVLAGRPRAHRAVGTACRLTPFSIVVPVHRVIRSDGTIGEYGAHPEVKRRLLEREGALSPLEDRVHAAARTR
ncbi:methylated-DNA--[protein]-cysteine S-methyltransferase [Microbacterium gorillae]|uniref:methylated-DNA--[protein]-cysteine S-methyltransferase n=1 Tax=Microbacterium gorillae TaxID=1231063 RepID=UPI00058AFBFA|nr:methylated-DNA--[protein]-cysteine S-methyltransferase [Microbacterium gorillae]